MSARNIGAAFYPVGQRNATSAPSDWSIMNRMAPILNMIGTLLIFAVQFALIAGGFYLVYLIATPLPVSAAVVIGSVIVGIVIVATRTS